MGFEMSQCAVVAMLKRYRLITPTMTMWQPGQALHYNIPT